jgi:hypothetical protein
VSEPTDLPDQDLRRLGRLLSEHGTLSGTHIELLAAAGMMFVLFLGGGLALGHYAPQMFEPDFFLTAA